MLRHEYADHVAALVFAELAAASSQTGPLSTVGPETFAVLASFASRAGEALAAVRYPEAREVAAPADTCECATCDGDMFLGDDSEGHAKPCPECVRAGRIEAGA